MSESEAELDTNDNQVIVPDKMQTNEDLKNTKNAIRLTEIGPRLKLKLIKIQEGLQDGDVLYHFFMNKTPEELQQLRDALKLKKLVAFILVEPLINKSTWSFFNLQQKRSSKIQVSQTSRK